MSGVYFTIIQYRGKEKVGRNRDETRLAKSDDS